MDNKGKKAKGRTTMSVAGDEKRGVDDVVMKKA
jgi:hypothetical protein